MKTYFFILLSAFSIANFAASAPESLDEMLNATRLEHKYPALAAAIICNGILVENSTVGIRKWGDSTPVKATDAFHLGSCTKAMTATLVAMLVEEGKLRWGATLGELFVDLHDEMHPDYRKVTIDQLLAHRGSCPSKTWPQGKTFDDIHNLSGTVRERRAQYIAMILHQPPEAEPGTQHIYSNAGYTILGAITERVTGMPWEQLMQERLFVPLHMTTAGFGPMGTPAR